MKLQFFYSHNNILLFYKHFYCLIIQKLNIIPFFFSANMNYELWSPRSLIFWLICIKEYGTWIIFAFIEGDKQTPRRTLNYNKIGQLVDYNKPVKTKLNLTSHHCFWRVFISSREMESNVALYAKMRYEIEKKVKISVIPKGSLRVDGRPAKAKIYYLEPKY